MKFIHAFHSRRFYFLPAGLMRLLFLSAAPTIAFGVHLEDCRMANEAVDGCKNGQRWSNENVPHCSVRDIKVAAPIESNAHEYHNTSNSYIAALYRQSIDGVGRAQRRRYISRAAWSPPLRKTTPVVVRQAHDNAVACCPPLQGRVWSKRRTKAAGALSFQNRISPLVWLEIAFHRRCGWVSTRMSKSPGLNRSRLFVATAQRSRPH